MKTISKLSIIIICLLNVLFLYSQEEKVRFTVQQGFFKAGDYKNIQPGLSIGGELSYYINPYLFISAHYNYGSNDYYEDSWLSNAPESITTHDGANNATVILNNIGATVGGRVFISRWLNVSGQLGVSQIIKILKDFPVRYHNPDAISGDFKGVDNAFLSMAFPLKLNLAFRPLCGLNAGFLKYTEVGYSAGTYMSPDFGFFTGFYHGFQLSLAF